MVIYRAIDMLINIIEILILARVILSYIPNMRSSRFYEIVYTLTEPVLYPVRNVLDRIGLNMGTIDFSPIMAFLLINIIRNVLFRII